MKELSEKQKEKLKVACENLINKILKTAMDNNDANTYEDGANKATRLTLAYLMKFGLLDIDNLIRLDEAISSLTDEDKAKLKEEGIL